MPNDLKGFSSELDIALGKTQSLARTIVSLQKKTDSFGKGTKFAGDAISTMGDKSQKASKYIDDLGDSTEQSKRQLEDIHILMLHLLKKH